MRALLSPFKFGLSRAMLRLASPFARLLSRCVPENLAYPAFARHGYHLLRKHYYLPIPDEEDLAGPLVQQPSAMVGVDLNDAGALALLDDVIVKYQAEFQRSFPLHAASAANGFHLINGGFMAGDAPVRAHLPMTALMVLYTAFGLWLLSAPTA